MIYRVMHNKDNPYFQLNRCSVNDERLSFKAVGILAYLLSKPDNWKIIEDDLVKRHADGATSVRSGLKELKDLGYVKTISIREHGKIIGWESQVFEQPQSEESQDSLDMSHNVGKPRCGDATLCKTSAIVINDGLISNEVKRNTLRLAPPLSDSQESGFNLEGKNNETKPPSYSMTVAQRLYQALAEKRRIRTKPNLQKWADEIRTFLIKAEITREEMEPALSWIIEHMEDGQFTPQIFSVKSFIDKFANIEARMRQSNESVRNKNQDDVPNEVKYKNLFERIRDGSYKEFKK